MPLLFLPNPSVPADDAENPRVSPCHDGTHTCQAPARCQPGVGTEYTCQCPAGYRGDGRGCRGQQGWGELVVCAPTGTKVVFGMLGCHSTHRASPMYHGGKLRQGAGGPCGSAPGVNKKEEGKKGETEKRSKTSGK